MKTPINMLESLAADITENTSLIEVIYRNNELPPEVDNAIACLIRSMQKTNETAYEYIESLSNNPKLNACADSDKFGLTNAIFDAVITAKKLEALSHTYSDSYFSDKDNDNPACYMAATIFDYAIKICAELKAIQLRLE
ncbi:hypothetical protein [Kluyvera intermedia]|uniref:hypothetical protein n=1 Tax=Kluyvera intermedia TaxID=61648 RepID=UPI00372D02F0